VPAASAPYVKLTPEQEKQCRISIKQAAEIKNLSVASFKKYYSHIIEQATPGRLTVKIGDLFG
jgi:hypothetical protein